ncbi:oxysterol-binding protein-related protein 1-like [Denticeps clupeoides]|uniref:oxysterol-binding protein-related protein 1-like n=1 Tax=Denticeps clupeoides TaxID=299321 RepID=UPI0010A4E176|nr:oxysterol-binding protein-related protein 1-like [Denticeps clupeoides]
MDPVRLEEKLLQYAEAGQLGPVRNLLQARINQEISLDINWTGKRRSAFGWTALHLASHFGHKDVVEELLKAGADMNLQNGSGDTALHEAALAGRKEAVLLLLRYDACATVINSKSQVPRDLTTDDEITTMLEAAERREERRLEEKLLEAARDGDSTVLSQLLSRRRPPDIHCRDLMGNTPLHCAASRRQKLCVFKLLRSGASPYLRNKNDQSVFDLASSDEIRLLLEGTTVAFSVSRFEGPLWKKSNILGWRSHWIVLQDGELSWYRNQGDAAEGVGRQGSQMLAQAYCTFIPSDKCSFTLKCNDGSFHFFKVSSQNTDPEVTRNKWLDVLGDHSAWGSFHSSVKEAEVLEKGERAEMVSSEDLTDALLVAETCQQKLETQVSIFHSMVRNEENENLVGPVLLKAREACGLSAESCSALRICLDLLSKRQEVWSLQLEQEVEKNKILTTALKDLAAKRVGSTARKSPTLSTSSEDEFYDAISDCDSGLTLSHFLLAGMSGDGNHGSNGNKGHRTSLPAPMFSRNDVCIWSILKKCIGMELSKITMPVVFNEPLSFLQRLTEYMEHTYLIHQANTSSNSIERMKCIASFAVSAVASQWERTGKPFNPLLGETFEVVRDDLGFRWMSEQVSHHPPVSAFHAEGVNSDFVFHGSIYPKLKFWGKSVEAEPKGIITLELPKHNEAYTWTNPTCCVHNIIVGQLWIEQYGNVEVINHKTGERCILTFKSCGLFGKELHKVEGYILDKSKKKVCAIYGKWTECLYTVDSATFDSHKKADKKSVEEKKSNKQSSVDEEPEEMPLPEAETVQVIPGSELVWKISPRPANSAQFYAFTTFAMQLNEMDESMEQVLPRTDCRLRPDIRAMENGDIDKASAEKKRLEEKQRGARKNRSKSSDEWKTRWFQQGPNPHNGAQDWLYSGGYWDRNYAQAPDIY